MLTEAERARLLTAWNDTTRDVPAADLARPVRGAGRPHPGGARVTSRDQALTFGELNAKANRLARLLVSQGAGPEQVVAVAHGTLGD